MSIAGRINITLSQGQGRVTHVNVQNTRPQAAKLLLGKTPEQVLATVPLLFSVCSNAQAYAALSALCAAQEQTSALKFAVEREILLQVEMLREHAWRLILDWSVLVGLSANKQALAAFFKFDQQFKQCLFIDRLAYRLDTRLNQDTSALKVLTENLCLLVDEQLFQGGLAGFLELHDEAALLAFCRDSTSLAGLIINALYQRNWTRLGESAVPCLADLDPQSLAQALQIADLNRFSCLPQWQNACFETTVLNRQQFQPLLKEIRQTHNNGLLLRLLARLREVAVIPGRLQRLLAGAEAQTPATAGHAGFGVSMVQAARGLLIHSLRLEAGKIADYAIIAPTEWNFHPEGVVVQGLRGLQFNDDADLCLQAQLFINAVDPCVEYDLTCLDSNLE